MVVHGSYVCARGGGGAYRCFATLARDQLSIRECMGRRRQVILAQAFHAFVVESKRGVEVGVGAYPPWRSTQVSRAGNGGKVRRSFFVNGFRCISEWIVVARCPVANHGVGNDIIGPRRFDRSSPLSCVREQRSHADQAKNGFNIYLYL